MKRNIAAPKAAPLRLPRSLRAGFALRTRGLRLRLRGRELNALDDSLNALAQMDPWKARVVELRFFGGLSVEKTAEVLKISSHSVMHDWKLAKAWLGREMIEPAELGREFSGGMNWTPPPKHKDCRSGVPR